MENTAYRQRFFSPIRLSGKSHDWHALLDEQLNTIAHVISESTWFQ